MLLNDKVVLVTGSTRGIGRAIATCCVREGARVLVHGRNRQQGQQVVKSLGARAVLHLDDLADPESPRRIVAAAMDAFGQLDAVVNNAALVVRSDFHSTDVRLFDRVIATNLRAPLLLIQAAEKPLMRARGCVLNIGSINAYHGEEKLLAYSLSKGGLMTLSRNLGDVLHRTHGIRVNHFNVGWVLTDNEYQHKLDDGLPPDWPQKLPAQIAPAGRLIRPEEIAMAATWWISEQSRPISGSVIDLEQYPVAGRLNTPEEL
jgi:NAD(P)-dependent dehydrogenase (short-subunit alcohol dehydrogenase family)